MKEQQSFSTYIQILGDGIWVVLLQDIANVQSMMKLSCGWIMLYEILYNNNQLR